MVDPWEVRVIDCPGLTLLNSATPVWLSDPGLLEDVEDTDRLIPCSKAVLPARVKVQLDPEAIVVEEQLEIEKS